MKAYKVAGLLAWLSVLALIVGMVAGAGLVALYSMWLVGMAYWCLALLLRPRNNPARQYIKWLWIRARKGKRAAWEAILKDDEEVPGR